MPRSVAVAIFVKTPGRSSLKTRLATSIGQQAAEEFHTRAAKTTAAVAAAITGNVPVQLYWSVAETEALHDPLWSEYPTIPQGDGGLGARLHHVYERLLNEHAGVILLGADAPQLPVATLQQAASTLLLQKTPPQFVLGRATDGGFYLFGGARPIPATVWEQVPYSEPTTAAALCEQLRPLGEIVHLPPLFDVDTIDEFRQLANTSPDPQWRPEQLALWTWMNKLLKT